MTYALLLQMLTEAESRRDNESLPADVRERSGETASICYERMARQGITIHQLRELAAAE